MTTEISSMEIDDQINTNPKFSINVLQLLKSSQMQHGLRFGDYTRYRRYCTARLRRLYKSLKFTHGRGKYTKKSITLSTVTEVRFLHLVLYTAERAWSHAMEKRQLPDGPNARQRSYLIGRLRKAVKWATLFAELCAIKGDSRTSLEAEAYASYMKGSLLFEQDQNWDIALKSFKSARVVYEELGKYGDLENQVLCRERVEELEPSIRYCLHKIGESNLQASELVHIGEIEGPALDLFKAKLEAVMDEARSQQAASMTEFHWLGHRYPISNAKTRVSILKAQDLEKELHDLPAEKRLAVFDKIFAAYHDARGTIRNDLATAGNSENIKDDLSGLDKAIGAILGQRTIERNQLLVSIAKSKLSKNRDEKNEKVTKPEELVRLYDLLLQNTSDLSDLLSSGRERKEQEVALSEECEIKSLIFRAERCFFLGKSYSSAGKRAEAYSLFSLARSLSENALKKLRSVANHDQVMIKELETLYSNCRSSSCVEHAMGIMEHEKVPEDLSKKISSVSISETDKKFRPASLVLGQMIETRKPVSDIMDSVGKFCVENKCEGLKVESLLYGMIIDGYKNKGMLNEAVFVVLGINGSEKFPDFACVNSLMTSLLKYRKNELVLKVFDKMVELKIVPDVYIYTNLISALCKDGKVSDAKRVFVEMGENGCDPSLVTYNVLIGGLCRSGLIDEAFEVKSSMTEKGLVPDRYTYTTLIDGLCKMKRLNEAKIVLEDMSKVGVVPDHVAYSALIDGFMKQGCVDEALKLKDEMFVNGVRLNVVTYNSIISGLCKSRRFEEAFGILTGMKEKGTFPDVYCYNSLIIGLCNDKRMEEVKSVLAQMGSNGVKPNAFTYGAVINGYSKIPEMETADKYFNEMVGFNIMPDRVIFTSMIDGHCKQGNTKEAFSIFESMAGKNILPDVHMYSVLINGLAKHGLMEKALEVLSESIEKGLNPDVVTYSSIISGFCKKGDFLEAFNMVDEMICKGVNPNIVTYNILIGGLCKSGDLKKARELFDGISCKGLIPDGVTYATMIDGYCKSGNLCDGFELFDKMDGNGIQPDYVVYNSLLNGCCKEQKVEKALTLFHKMVEKGFVSAHTYNTLLDLYCKLGKLVEADELLKDMIDNKKIKPNHVTFTILIDCYCKAEMMEEAEDLFIEMQNRDLVPTIVTYTCLAHGYMRSGNKIKMISIFEEMLEKGISLDKVVYNMLEEDQGSLEKSFMLLDELLQKGLSGKDVYDKLVDGLCQNGKFKEAVASIDEIGKRGVMLSFATCSTLVHSLHSSEYKNKLAGVLKSMEGFGWVPHASSLTELIDQYEPDGV